MTIGVIVGLPALLAAVALQRFDHVSPVHGLNAPWRWSLDDLRSWARRLTHGLDSSAELVDLFFRLALIAGWICVAIVIYTVVDEVVFQLRHGMPSAHHRRLIGLGSLGRKLASVLVAVLPLVVNATPSLAGAPTVRSVASAGVSPARMPAFAEPATGWSLVEVCRGDSVWSIAERIADGRDVATIAKQIVVANLGTVMNDGHRFSTPALIETGWMLNVPVAEAAPMRVAEMDEVAFPLDDSYVVVRGDSYWKIAEHHLGVSVGPSAVATYTEQLMTINAPLLGYANERVIRPGDVVQLGSEATPAVRADPVAAVPPLDAAPVVTDPLPSIAVDPPLRADAPPVTVDAQLPMPFPPPKTDAASGAAVQPPIVTVEGLLSGDGIPMKRGLGAALLLAGGALAVLDARRRQQLRGAQVGARFAPPTDSAAETERLLRSLSPADRLARLDLALRDATPRLVRQQARILAAEIADDGEIRLYTDRVATVVADRWFLDIEAGAWRLPANVSILDLADAARDVGQPCPAIVHIGESAGGHLFVDLEAIGVLSIEAPPTIAASIVRCAAASLAVSPFLESSRIFTVGLEVEVQLGSSNVESHGSVAAAAAAVSSTVGSISRATSGTVTTHALRCSAHGGEAWEPSLLLAVGGRRSR